MLDEVVVWVCVDELDDVLDRVALLLDELVEDEVLVAADVYVEELVDDAVDVCEAEDVCVDVELQGMTSGRREAT